MTDTKETELFDLCRAVYEATGWDDTKECYREDGEVDSRWCGRFTVPLYTSDYLLEKLPPVVQDPFDKKFRHIQMWINGDGEVHAIYTEPYDTEFRGAYGQTADTPLKALLKLTLALAKEGLLPSQNPV